MVIGVPQSNCFKRQAYVVELPVFFTTEALEIRKNSEYGSPVHSRVVKLLVIYVGGKLPV